MSRYSHIDPFIFDIYIHEHYDHDEIELREVFMENELYIISTTSKEKDDKTMSSVITLCPIGALGKEVYNAIMKNKKYSVYSYFIDAQIPIYKYIPKEERMYVKKTHQNDTTSVSSDEKSVYLNDASDFNEEFPVIQGSPKDAASEDEEFPRLTKIDPSFLDVVKKPPVNFDNNDWVEAMSKKDKKLAKESVKKIRKP